MDYPQYDHRPPPDYEYNRYDSHNHFSSSDYRPPNYDLDRYDNVKPIDRPIYSEIQIYNDPPPNFPRPSYDRPSYDRPSYDRPSYDRPSFDRPSHDRPSYDRPSHDRPSHESDYQPPRRPPPPPPAPSSNEYLGPYKPPHDSGFSSFGYRPKKPEQFPNPNYLDRERESPPNYKPIKNQPSQPFIPYAINKDTNSWATYGGSYGGSQHYNKQSHEYWGLTNEFKRNDANFNYFNLGSGAKINPNENAVLSYPGSKYDTSHSFDRDSDKNYYGSLWTRRPGQDGEEIERKKKPKNKKIS